MYVMARENRLRTKQIIIYLFFVQQKKKKTSRNNFFPCFSPVGKLTIMTFLVECLLVYLCWHKYNSSVSSTKPAILCAIVVCIITECYIFDQKLDQITHTTEEEKKCV